MLPGIIIMEFIKIQVYLETIPNLQLNASKH